jgi:hypothetical protein
MVTSLRDYEGLLKDNSEKFPWRAMRVKRAVVERAQPFHLAILDLGAILRIWK